VQLNAAGQLELRLKAPWCDGTTHLVMSPLEFMQRLAAPAPRPRPRLNGRPNSGLSPVTTLGRLHAYGPAFTNRSSEITG